MTRNVAPYGEWVSPVSAADTISSAVSFGWITRDGDDLYWIEGRPAEGGRQVLVRRTADGAIADVTPSPINVRTRVHEYGGTPYVVADGVIWYSEFSDQRLYRLTPGSDPTPVTQEPSLPAAVRYADGRLLLDGRLVLVRETHTEDTEPVNDLVILDPATGEETVFVIGADFYGCPRPSPDGSRIAWLEWNHPNMPWDGTRLMVAPVDGSTPPVRVAGGDDESVFQPEWTPDGTLVYVTDPTGWWNLYSWDGSDPVPLYPVAAEFGLPMWVFGSTTHGFLSDGRIFTTYFDNGEQRLGVLVDGDLTPIETPYSYHQAPVTDGRNTVVFVGYRTDGGSGVIELDTDTGEFAEIRTNPMAVPEGFRSRPRVISFPSAGELSHGIYYPPANADFTAPPGVRPPLIVRIHGGPTSQVYAHLRPSYAFWTSRGFGLVDVNYRGSTGYGRVYRDKLKGTWGVVDVEDAAAAAAYLVDTGEVDGDRLLISGGSAGGYTTLAALAFTDTFAAGASYYGIADLGLLADDTHKFEARYLDTLVSTDPEVLRARSPLYSVDEIRVPVALFQGLLDRVVPPEQAEVIAGALAGNGVPYAHITYANEDHGFRDSVNIVHSLESELGFYGQVLGFTPAGDLPAVEIVGQE